MKSKTSKIFVTDKKNSSIHLDDCTKAHRTGKILKAVTGFGSQIALEHNAKRILELALNTARDCTDAESAAASIRSIESSAEAMVTSGVDPEIATALARQLPQGEVVTNLRQSRRPCRLATLSGNPTVMGLPAEYPPTHSFLGVPIITGDEVCGWICLTNKLGADAFGEDDERIVCLIAMLVGRTRENCELRGIKQRVADMETEAAVTQKSERDIIGLNGQLSERVRELSSSLEAAQLELESFSNNIGRDLREPLRHIQAFVELLHLSAGSSLSPKAWNYLSEIARSAELINRLSSALLDFSRAGHAEMHHEPVDLGEVAQSAIATLEPETKDRRVVWKTGELPQVNGDRELLGQAVGNLLSNAVKYTRRCPLAEIEIGAMPGLGETVVYVRDNGIGFDMKSAGGLFGIFQRLHAKKEFEGTGVGLANVRRIIARHGGRTWADAKINCGATFYFSLPAVTRSAVTHA